MASLSYIASIARPKKLLQEKLNTTTPTLKLICTLPIMSSTTNRQFRVDGHFKSVWNNRRRLYKTATPTRYKTAKILQRTPDLFSVL